RSNTAILSLEGHCYPAHTPGFAPGTRATPGPGPAGAGAGVPTSSATGPPGREAPPAPIRRNPAALAPPPPRAAAAGPGGVWSQEGPRRRGRPELTEGRS